MHRRFSILAILVIATVFTGKSIYGDLYWVGGNGFWDDPFRWLSMPGGIPGAGPPNFDTRTMFQGLSGPLAVTLDTDGLAESVILELDNGDAAFNLAGHALTLKTDFQLNASNNQDNHASIDGGFLTARALTSRTFGTGQSRLVVGPSTQVSLRKIILGVPPAFASQLTSLGFGAELIIQGSVFTDDTCVVEIDMGGMTRIDDGTFDMFGQLVEIDNLGVLELLNNGTTAIHGTMDVGINGAADVNISTNSTVFTFAPVVLGVNSTATGNVTLQDSGSRWEVRDHFIVGSAGNGVVEINDGAQMLVLDPLAHVMLGTSGSGNGQVIVGSTVGAAALFDTQSSVYVGGTNTGAGGSGQLLVNPTGIAQIDGQLRVWGQGRVEANGGDVTASQLVVTSGGRLILDNGGSFEANTVNLQSGANLTGFNDGALIIRGMPGQIGSLVVGSSSFGFGSDAGLSTIHLDDAIAFVTDWTIANFPGATAKTIVEGQSSRLQASNDLRVTGANTQTTGFLEVLDGAVVDAGDDVSIGFTSTSVAHVIVDGVASNGRRSTLRNNAQGQDAEIEIGRGGQATLDVTNGALVQSLNNISIASFPTANAAVNVTGGTAGISQLTASADLAVGGFATIDAAGGTALLLINADGQVRADDRTKVYAGGSVVVNPAGSLLTNRLHLCGELNNTGFVNVGASTLPASDGSLVVGSTGELVLDGGTLRTESLTMETGATLDLIDGTLLIENGTFSNGLTSFVIGSSSGSPTIELAQSAQAEVTFAWKIGSAAGTTGRTVLRDGGTRLANTGGGGGADLVIGGFGDGLLEVLDGAEADFNDDVVIADQPGSSGGLFVRGVAGGQRARVFASGGTNNDLLVGRNGFGSLDIVDGALVEAADDVFVGLNDLAGGANGFITVSGTQDGFQATLSAADDLAIGASGVPGNLTNLGVGVVVIHSGGEVHVGDATLVGPDDTLALTGGTLRTGRLILDADPSRLQWSAGTIALTASGLTIESGGTLDRVVTLETDMNLFVNSSRRVALGGALLMEGGRFEGNDEVIVDSGGFVGGDGTIQTPVFFENSGRIQPDGVLRVEGHFVQDPAGELLMGLGPASGSDDLLLVTQFAQLGGTLTIQAGSALDPDVPGTVDAYTLVSAGTLQDSFDTVIYDVTELTALANVAADGSFLVYVGTTVDGLDGLFRGLDYFDATSEVRFTNYLAIPGDANGDQFVDGQDFIIWNSNKFQTGTDWLTGDFTGDGVTDGQDFIVWNTNKFTSTGTMLSVPEPGSVSLVFLGLALIASALRVSPSAKHPCLGQLA